jgi:hypothetical protein
LLWQLPALALTRPSSPVAARNEQVCCVRYLERETFVAGAFSIALSASIRFRNLLITEDLLAKFFNSRYVLRTNMNGILRPGQGYVWSENPVRIASGPRCWSWFCSATSPVFFPR